MFSSRSEIHVYLWPVASFPQFSHVTSGWSGVPPRSARRKTSATIRRAWRSWRGRDSLRRIDTGSVSRRPRNEVCPPCRFSMPCRRRLAGLAARARALLPRWCSSPLRCRRSTRCSSRSSPRRSLPCCVGVSARRHRGAARPYPQARPGAGGDGMDVFGGTGSDRRRLPVAHLDTRSPSCFWR